MLQLFVYLPLTKLLCRITNTTMIYTHINNETREAVMRLYGAIGQKLDGDTFAGELAALDGGDYSLIRLRINSPGGDVFQGMSIVSAMLSMKTPVHVHIDGVAASMAAVIAITAKKVYMMDYAKLMIHDPYFAQKQDNLSDNEAKTLSRITDMLRQVLSRRGRKGGDISRLMSEETWFSADEAKAAGLCDEITASTAKGFKNLTPAQLVAAIDSATDTGDLRGRIIDLMGLPDTATDDDIIDNITALLSGAETAEQSVQNAVRQGIIDSNQTANFVAMAKGNLTAFKGFVAEKKKEQKTQLAELMLAAIKEGKVLPQERHIYDTVGEQLGLSVVSRLICILPDRIKLSSLIDNGHLQNRANWGLSEYRKYAPAELRDNPLLYASLMEKEGRKMELNEDTLDWFRKHNPEYLKANSAAYQRVLHRTKQ